MNWKMKPVANQAEVKVLAASLATQKEFPNSLAEILVQRGIQSFEQARKFFQPASGEIHDPFLMKDMDIAVARLIRARQSGETILIYGDYDVDGTTAVAVMCQVFKDLEFRFDYYIPDRYKEGYGLSYEGVDHAGRMGASIILTLDCGIKAFEKIRYANEKGIDVIICDHHTPGAELPDALAVLDPKRPNDDYPFKELTGCGVGLKLASALVQQMAVTGLDLPDEDYDPIRKYADLLVLSIACDIVPIIGENRTFAHLGLEKLRHNPGPGIDILKRQAEHSRNWDISDLVFFLGPRINSAGRLEHGSAAVEVLMGESEDLNDLALALQDSNNARKELDKLITDEALAQIEAAPDLETATTQVLFDEKWHKGIIGIVASRIIEKHYRPTIMLTRSGENLVGSARSVAGFDLYAALEDCDPHILQWGGHTYAAGLTLKPEKLEAFREAFERSVREKILEEQKSPTLWIDTSLGFREIDARFIRLMNRMEPFGPKNRRPIFQTKGVKVLQADILKDVHVRFMLEKDDRVFKGIGFNLAEKWFSLKAPVVDLAYQPSFNHWNGRTSIDLRIKDIKAAYES
ncbi:MAG: single-stranded-DNA-specific exonuclease RecJ [Bacteroidia bacterium]|nr:single-stranded-DNA-specific exonuclease RecJ [Bacteroidia bacterium]